MAANINTAVAGLKLKSADYSAVETALGTVPADLTIYTAASKAAVDAAVAAVVRGYDITRQADVDAMAKAINDAVAGLKLNYADYTAVDNAITAANAAIADTNYTAESIQAVKDAINAVVRNLLSGEQTRVNNMAKAINDAVAALTYKPLDATQYNTVVNKIPTDLTPYTDASVSAVNNAKSAAAAFLAANDIRKQADFNALVSTLDTAIGALKYKDADYTAVNNAIASANALTQSNYVDFSGVTAAVNAVVTGYNITRQADVDAMAKAITDAIAALTLKPADYTAVTAAKNSVPADLTVYTDETKAAVEAAVAAVVEGLDITKQATVDGYAANINSAVKALKYKGADYTALNALVDKANALDSNNYTNYDDIYWNYIYNYINVEIPAHKDYNITEQSKVDAMTTTLQGYIDMLTIKAADYTAVNAKVTEANTAIATGYYTNDSVAALQTILNGINYNYDILHQSDVDAYVPAITTGIANLVEKPSDFSAIDALYNKAAALDPTLYSNYDDIFYGKMYTFYSNDVANAKTTYTKISQQAEVDKLLATLQGYYDQLQLAEQKQAIFTAKDGSTTVIKNNYIYGLKQRLTKSVFESTYVTMENVTVAYTYSGSSHYMGTGTVVTVTSNLTNQVIGTYTIVIYGDINGDGLISATDKTALANTLSGSAATLTGAYKMAANINGDRLVNASDKATLTNVLSSAITINQVTGKAG